MSRPRSLRTTLATLALLMAPAALAGCSNDIGSSGDQGYVAGRGIITTLPAAERTPPWLNAPGATVSKLVPVLVIWLVICSDAPWPMPLVRAIWCTNRSGSRRALGLPTIRSSPSAI